MSNSIKIRLTLILVAAFTFICVISAGWVIAQSVQQVNPSGAKKAADGAALVVPQAPQKLYGETGREDPFIPIGAAGGSTGKPGAKTPGSASQGEGFSAGMMLTGIFFANGDRYAIIKSGYEGFIVKEGERCAGYTVSRITDKAVALVNNKGKTTLELQEYTFSAKDEPVESAAPSNLMPPQMQPPTPMGAPESSGGNNMQLSTEKVDQNLTDQQLQQIPQSVQTQTN
ncbi:MAG: hypothetical protein ABIH00_06820 [Armatimonadota bacterium]